jgi:hypothetical protein
MVTNDFHVQGILTVPAKTYSPLVIDPDAVLSHPILRQSFQPIPGRGPEVLKRNRRIKQFQFLSSPLLNPGVNPFCKRAVENSFGGFVSEAANHGRILTRDVINGKR